MSSSLVDQRLRNTPSNEGDIDLIPGSERFHMLQGNYTCAPQPSLCTLESVFQKKRNRHNVNPVYHN